MFFKPSIFISSVLSLDKIRQEITDFFEGIGAEVLLFEKNLTPSVNKSSYRQDILEADFVILIVDEQYGSKTDQNISGTHEEYKIIKNSDVPMHIYLKKREGSDEDLNLFKEEIFNDNMSFYYYKSEEDLLKRMKKTPFIIAKEISLRAIKETKIDDSTLLIKTAERDYKIGLRIIRDFEEIKQAMIQIGSDFLTSSILVNYFEIWDMTLRYAKWQFIDTKIDILFTEMLSLWRDYAEESGNKLSIIGRDTYTLTTQSGSEINYYRLEPSNHPFVYDSLKKKLGCFITAYESFEEEIFLLKRRADLRS